MASKYQSDYSVGDDNVQVWGMDIHNPVFFVSASLIRMFVLAILQFPEVSNEALAEARSRPCALTRPWPSSVLAHSG